MKLEKNTLKGGHLYVDSKGKSYGENLEISNQVGQEVRKNIHIETLISLHRF